MAMFYREEMMWFTAFTDAQYRVDDTYTIYDHKSQSSEADLILSRGSNAALVQPGSNVPLTPERSDRPPTVLKPELTAEWPPHLNAPYPQPKIASGKMSAILDAKGLQNFEGQPITLTVDFVTNATTTYVTKTHELTIDVGELIADAVLLVPTRWAVNAYALRAYAVFAGVVKSALKNACVINIGWKWQHGNIIDDKYDGIGFSLAVTGGIRTSLAVFAKPQSARVSRDTSPALREKRQVPQHCGCGQPGCCAASPSSPIQPPANLIEKD
uniref:Uncharacterized protein n=1 Tax=Blue fish point virus TaxID=2485865 RepID=A0A3G3BTR4_9VIRU|nr:hypothetical protein [Blue fish point virus]